MATLAARYTFNSETGWRHRRKYQSRNPLQGLVLGRFHRRVYGWIQSLRPRLVLDFGCGEGFFWKALAELGPVPDVVGLDRRDDAIDAARASLPGMTFLNVDLFEFAPEGPRFDLVIASEVLEHLHDPGPHLEKLCALSGAYVLLTVPREPFFQLCNLMRGRDLRRLGNHPEHVQRWSRNGFLRFASRYLDVERFECVFPFTLVLGRPKPAFR